MKKRIQTHADWERTCEETAKEHADLMRALRRLARRGRLVVSYPGHDGVEVLADIEHVYANGRAVALTVVGLEEEAV